MTDTRKRLMGAKAYLKPRMRLPELPPGLDIKELALPVMRPFLGELCVYYLVDQGETYGYVNELELREIGLGADALHEIGLANLLNHVDDRMRFFHHGAVHGIQSDPQFTASLVLLDAIWEGPAKPFLKGAPVVAVPAKQILFFADSASPAAVNELRQHLARGAASNAIELSDQLFIRDGGGFWHLFGSGGDA
ncbi:MAG: DUF1444 family protein [Inhella sp.]